MKKVPQLVVFVKMKVQLINAWNFFFVYADMCPKAVSTPTNLSSTSHVEDLTDPLVELFNALTEEHDATGRWTTYTYPVHRDLSQFLNPAALQNIELGVG